MDDSPDKPSEVVIGDQSGNHDMVGSSVLAMPHDPSQTQEPISDPSLQLVTSTTHEHVRREYNKREAQPNTPAQLASNPGAPTGDRGELKLTDPFKEVLEQSGKSIQNRKGCPSGNISH